MNMLVRLWRILHRKYSGTGLGFNDWRRTELPVGRRYPGGAGLPGPLASSSTKQINDTKPDKRDMNVQFKKQYILSTTTKDINIVPPDIHIDPRQQGSHHNLFQQRLLLIHQRMCLLRHLRELRVLYYSIHRYNPSSWSAWNSIKLLLEYGGKTICSMSYYLMQPKLWCNVIIL